CSALIGTIHLCQHGWRLVAWPKRQTLSVLLTIVSGSRLLEPHCAKAKTSLIGKLPLRSGQRVRVSRPTNCSSARNRRRLRSVFERRRPNSALYRSRNDPLSSLILRSATAPFSRES